MGIVRRAHKNEAGAALVEHPILIATIAFAAIVAIAALGAYLTKPLCEVHAMNQESLWDPYWSVDGEGANLTPQCQLQWAEDFGDNCAMWGDVWACGN